MATKAVTRPTALRTDETGHPRRWLVLAIMSFATFVLFADNTIVNTALPSIARDLHATTSNLQWIVDSYILMLAGLLLVGGAVADIFGRKRWFAIGMVIFAAGATTAALSTSANQLILGRAIQGLGGAFVMPTTLSIITSVFPRDSRAKAIGIWTGVTGLAMGFGPVLGGYIVDAAQWQTVFWLHLPAVALILGGLAVVPESRDERKRRIDIPGAVLGTAALTSLVYAIISGGEAGWTAQVVVTAGIVSAIMLTAFVLVEAHASDPMLPLHFFKQRDFTTAVVIIGLVFFTVTVTFFFLTQFYQLVQGRSALVAGLLGVPCAIAMGVGAPLSAMFVKRVGPKVLVISAMASLALGMALLSQLSVETSTLQIVATMCLFGLAGGLGLVPLTDTVMAAVPVDQAGVASAVNDVSRELGAALGIAAMGSLVNSMYRANIDRALGGSVPADTAHAAGEGIGIAAALANSMPAEAAARLLAVANTAFVDAVGNGFLIGAAVLLIPMLAAAIFLPNRSRLHQAEASQPAGLQPTAITVAETSAVA
ncbi:MAG: MFS transporter [Tepidiformaceae bacterium]